MEIKISIDATGLENAINNLATALSTERGVVTISEPNQEKKQPKKEKARPDRVSEQPEPDPEETTDDTPTPTIVELRAKAQEIGKTPEGKKAIKELLNKFGSKSISDVPENKRAAFMAKLEEL